jgi:Lipase (class 3)
MIPIDRRAMLRATLGSGAALSAASLMPSLAEAASYTFGPGFNVSEASDLLYMCDQLYAQPNGIPMPSGFTQRWVGAPIFQPSFSFPPFDNLWSLWQSATDATTFALITRGTVLKVGSILEDLISVLVSATGKVVVGPVTIPYQFAADTRASIHAGFALGSLLLLNFPSQGILAQLASKVPPGSKIYVAGHSQGASLAVLLSSWFNYAAFSKGRNYSYKTYAFAEPKPGNDHYQTDYGKLLCNTGFGFRLTNSLDFIPQLPFTIEVPTDLSVVLPLQETATGFPLLFTLNASQRSAVTSVEQSSRANLQAGAMALARTQVASVGNFPFQMPIVDSLYFVSAATQISLIGTPCVGNQCNDLLWQHHTTTYYTLMQQQLTT